jgi:hypothetical protein
MFVQHGQYGKTFDEKKALRIFHDAMVWRKENNVYGKFTKDRSLFSNQIILDTSPERFPQEYLERHAIFFKNHDVNNAPIRKFVF